jgi:hypothetical protein
MESSSFTVDNVLNHYIFINGVESATFIKQLMSSDGGSPILSTHISGTFELEAGDYIDVRVFQNSGSSVSLHSGDSTSNQISIHRIGF